MPYRVSCRQCGGDLHIFRGKERCGQCGMPSDVTLTRDEWRGKKPTWQSQQVPLMTGTAATTVVQQEQPQPQITTVAAAVAEQRPASNKRR